MTAGTGIPGLGDQPVVVVDLAAVRALQAAVQAAFDALIEAPRACRYHGADFEKLGTEPYQKGQKGLPRCDSCKQPWRVARALDAIEAACQAGAMGQGARRGEVR